MTDTVGDGLIENNYNNERNFGTSKPTRYGDKLGMPAFVGAFGFMGFATWGLYTVIVSQITTIEKAFGLTSSETGWLLTVWEIGYVVCVAIAGYFTPKAHIPRTIGVVTIICGLSGLVCILPHFVVFEEPYISSNANTSSNAGENNLCSSHAEVTATTEPGTEKDGGVSKKTVAFAIFNLAMILMGIGKAPCHPYSSQYIDDNTKKENTGFYMSIAWSISIVGLAVGYAIGSAVSKVYVTLQPTVLSTTDTRFIGAWWLGFLGLGLLTFLTAIPMFFFPRALKTSNKTAIQRKDQSHRTLSDVIKEVKAASETLLAIVKNPLYMLNLAGCCLQILAFASFFGFEPKYMESQYFVPAWQSNIIIGVASIMSYCVGSVIGGVLTKKVKMTPYMMMRAVVCLFVVVVLVPLVMMFIGCPDREIYTPLDDKGLPATLSCDCSKQKFLPVCGDDGRNYFSPCHAGCEDGNLTAFTNCSLIPGGTATSGLCPTGCKMVWVYAAARFFANSIEAVASIPTFLVCMRSAGEDKKALAVGLSAAVTSLVSWLPGPVIGGKMVDSTCSIWTTAATSGEFCGHYDTAHQRKLLQGVQCGIRVVGLLFIIGGMFVARHVPDWNEEEPSKHEDSEDQTRKALVSNEESNHTHQQNSKSSVI